MHAAAEGQHRERPAAAVPVDPEMLPPVSEIAAAVLASPGGPPSEPLGGVGSPPPGGPAATARGGSPPASAGAHTALSDAKLQVAAAGGSPRA